MIKNKNNIFSLETKNTTYSFHILPSGHLEHLYYGNKLDIFQGYQAIVPKCAYPEGNLIVYDEKHPTIALENRNLEISTSGKGDIREPMVSLVFSDGSTTCDFLYKEYRIQQKQLLTTLASSYDETNESQTLIIVLDDVNHPVQLELHYTVFYESDVIVRSTKVINNGKDDIKIERLLSAQLDLDNGPFIFTTFKGAWVREMNRQDTKCLQGIVVNDSKAGVSSSRANPFVMLSKTNVNEDSGETYGCNLIYSGNHYEAVEVNSFGMTRLLSGINPFGFSFTLETNQHLESPEAVLTYSNSGYQGVSQHMHAFVQNHIVRGSWKKKERPVLLNSWEASYFDFNESKLLKLAKAGKEVGIELFVLDDGWFGKRNDDTSSLGDWYVNKKKLPNGMLGLSKKINDLGMDFGIWVEPEMVSYDSDCYRNHPSYTVEIPGQNQALGRHQLILDLTQKEVQNYLIEQMKNVFSSGNITYVKWDMNRVVSDAFSQKLEASRQGEFYHRYIIGLYNVLKVLTETFPHILFESCSSGGNRFDLGMMCYMPQVWASDNSDAICRAKIQTGCSYGYPMSVIGAHVSSCPNHQTLRQTPLDTRFQVACFGLLGYECNLADMSTKELQVIKEQVEWYKTYRSTLQYGDFYRLYEENGNYQWLCVSKDKKIAIGLYLQTLVQANYTNGIFKTKGLDPTMNYHFQNKPLVFDVRLFGDLINTIAPIHVKQDGYIHNMAAKFVKMNSEVEDYEVSGAILNNIGVRLKQAFGGTGYNDEVRFFQDFSSRLYIIKQKQ